MKKTKRKVNNFNKGFTIFEALIALGIIFIVFFAGSRFIVKSFFFSDFEEAQSTAIQNAREAVEVIIRELREANFSDHGEYALATINNQDLVFYSDVDDDGKMDKVEYFLDERMLKRSVTPPGEDNDYGGVGEINVLARYVNNGSDPIFIYYDENNSITGIKQEVRLVKIEIKVDVNPEKAPLEYFLQSDVHLRNLKDNF